MTVIDGGKWAFNKILNRPELTKRFVQESIKRGCVITATSGEQILDASILSFEELKEIAQRIWDAAETNGEPRP